MTGIFTRQRSRATRTATTNSRRTASSCRFLRASTTQTTALVTAPIQCEGSKTVKVSFEVATNRMGNIEYRIGVTGNGPITESWLRDRTTS